ncbi:MULTISPECIES: winged helix-turn-helix domain-containing protein [unclassified Methanosarcina]|uniref:winged helix-turn-helix domain-containing protein n=1 Tax=unclassified Methanosarcina TaxID=2644672 RepID=UPI000615EDA0|nr:MULTISPECIES: winged helix-turn-helix domain-containing protein [unclassified Methanosarcina]AKB19246.1 Transcriptional regulator, ArsR family [Methanosarcina sp. WWM596]AKB22924.1 Transcriptional regulator, ArsR family [Methanosarcina sp. WH1]
MKDSGRKKENFPESSKDPKDPEMVEIKAIREKLCDMHSDIKKVMEFSNRLRFETAMECSRQEYSNAILSHLYEDINSGLERNMVKKCPEKENCRSSFTALLQRNAGLVKQGRVDEALLSGNREKLDELRCGAPYSKCEQCFSEVSSLFTKQVNLMRSMRIYASNQEQKPDISALETSGLLREVLEPVSNPQRLEILRAVAFETKSFSAFSEITGLRGGNLLFHLQKLMDSGLILQQHERGDYMITEKGFKILKGLNELYSSLQSSQLQISAEKTPGENEEIRV